MSVQQSELFWRKSNTGSSDGGAVSGNILTSGLKNDLWPSISDASRIAGGTRYKKVFVCNDAVVDSLVVPSIWIFQQPTNMTQQIGLGFDDSADDTNTQGNMTAWSTDNVVGVISSSGDTRVVTIWGLDALGVPQTENVTLNGTTEALSLGTYSVVYGCHLSAALALTVSIREAAGGTTRGTMGSNKVACWLWLDAGAKASGIMLPSLIALGVYGVWIKQVWAPGAGGVRPNADILAVEEN